MAKGRVNGIPDDLLIGAVLLVGGYFVVKNVFGGGNSDNPDLIAEQSLPPGQNPFNYQFTPFVDFYNENTPQLSANNAYTPWNPWTWGNASTVTDPTMQQFFQSLKSSPPATSVWGFLNTVDLSARAEQLHNAISVSSWNPVSMSDQGSAMSALAGLGSQLAVAFIANYFWWNFGQDLLTFLNGSLTKPGLTPANLSQVISNVNSLPVNP